MTLRQFEYVSSRNYVEELEEYKNGMLEQNFNRKTLNLIENISLNDEENIVE